MARKPSDKDEVSGVQTTGHEWDGIRELDNPLPRWWLWVFYATIAASLVYWVLMPAWPGISGYTKGTRGHSDRANVAAEIEKLNASRAVVGAALMASTLEQIEADPELQSFALAAGGAAFGDNCATCHGAGGAGARGYPNLRDDVWLWGGTLEEIEHTIRVGVRSGHPQTRFSQMPAFGRDSLLQANQIADLTEYVVHLSGRRASASAVSRAAPLYLEQCASCHGADGKGAMATGSPDLTDAEWLYGGDRAAIRGQIWNGRGGVMPAWEQRFDAATVKALAVYVHANAGG